MVITNSLAADRYTPDSYHFDVGIRSEKLGWLPGEEFDALTGRMNHSMVDLEFSGNGLPIVVRRTFQQGVKYEELRDGYVTRTSRMSIDIPLLTFQSNGTNGEPHHCGSSWPTLRSAITFRTGSASIHFVKKYNDTQGIPFPTNAEYVSKDNWYISCDGITFVVHSPDGLVYRTG